jgi:hypothetical protein
MNGYQKKIFVIIPYYLLHQNLILVIKKVNDFLNKWEKINIVDIEDENLNNSKNESRGYFNVYNKEMDPFFKLVRCDKNDNSIENNVNSWPVIISSQVVKDNKEKNKELEIKDILKINWKMKLILPI